jgi:glutamate-1-semialdehyde 2,1-aminomutase
MYQAGTLSGNPVAMAAGLTTLEFCKAEGFYERLHRRASTLAEGLQSAAASVGIAAHTGATGGMLGMALSDRPVRNFDDAQAADHGLFAKFFWAMLDRGVWLPPSGYEAMFVSAAHDEGVIERVVEAANEAFEATGRR